MVENDIFCGSYMVYGHHASRASTACECVFAGAKCIEFSSPAGWTGGLYRRYYKGKQLPARKFAITDDLKDLVQFNSIVYLCGFVGFALASIVFGIAVCRCRRG